MLRTSRLCVIALIAWISCALAAYAAKPLVVLVSIDGFKPDYLYRGNSPTIEALGTGGAMAKGLVPAFPSATFPNHYSIVTGLVPDRHGIVSNYMHDPKIAPRPFSLIARDVQAMPAWWEEGVPLWVTLRRQGKRSSTLFWPGSEVVIHGVQPDDWIAYNDALTSMQRADKLLGWLDRPEESRAEFATLYLSEVDVIGHRFGPNSREVGEAVKRVDAALGHFIKGLERLGLAKSTTLVVLSDHGMTESHPSHAIDLKGLLKGFETAAIRWIGPVAGFAVSAKERRAVLERMSAVREMSCWPKDEMPARFRFGTHRRIPDVVCLANPGWSITDGRPFARGLHGYDPALPDMWGILIANGPAIRPTLIETAELIDFYPLLCRLLGVKPEQSTDASERLADLLVRPLGAFQAARRLAK